MATSPKDLRSAGYSTKEIGSVLVALKALEMDKEDGSHTSWSSLVAYAAEFTVPEIRAAGYASEDIVELIEELRRAGMTCQQARGKRFRPMECKAAGFTLQEARAAGYLQHHHMTNQRIEELWKSKRSDEWNEEITKIMITIIIIVV